MAQMMRAEIPQLNPEIMNGLAVRYMERSLDYVRNVFKSASKSFPEGLEFVDCERCTPDEEFMEITKIKNNRRTFDLASSSLYLVKFKFTFNGEPIPDRYMYLPYVQDAGIFYLGGSRFHITPVLSDKVISPGHDSIFVRLLRDKIIFKSIYHSMVVDGETMTTDIVFSPIYRKPKDAKRVPSTTAAETSIVHYLLAKYGFAGVFQKYCGFTPIVGESEINEQTYPSTDWMIFSSSFEKSTIRPKSCKDSVYNGTSIRLAIPKNQWNSMSKGLISGFFYVIDHFPNRFKMPLSSYLESIPLWKILLGHIIFSGQYGENKLYEDVQEHFASLDDYVDTIIVEKLKESGYRIDNFYDLMALILANFKNMKLESGGNTQSMYNKSLEILYYVHYDITSSLFKTNFRLGKLATKRKLTKEDVISAFNKNLKIGAVFGLSSGKIISESVSYSGDHKFFKITSKVTEQESLPGAARARSKRSSVNDRRHLDVSMIEAGSILYLPKSNPSPTNRINPFVNIDLATGTIVPNPKLKDVLERTQKLLKMLSEGSGTELDDL
jgi:hypothetical protein